MTHTAEPPSPVQPRIITLVLIASTGTLAMNIFLPSLPTMARHFEVDYSVIQLVVSLYLVATAFIQLVVGPLSDRFGRRPVVLAGMAIFAASTIAAIYAPTIEVLLACRVMQSTAAVGLVLSRAVVRDTVTNIEDAASRIGYVTMGMSLMPMIGPMIGGYLDEIYGWKSTFLLTFCFALVTLAVVFADLSETHRTRTTSMLAQVKAYPELFRSRRFWGYSMTAGFSSGAFFAFLGGGPFVATELLGMSPASYGLYFGLISIGYMGGNYMSARFSREKGVNRMMLWGSVVGLFSGLVPLSLLAFGIFTPLSVFGPAALVGFGNGMALPNANAGMVSVRPHLAGSAAGLGGTLNIACGAVLAFLAGAVLTRESGPMPLFLIMSASMAASIASSAYVMRVAQQAGEPDMMSGDQP
jgi:DHA1 family bicyclomycin/chloramphenicol resistance-like MFS transporter